MKVIKKIFLIFSFIFILCIATYGEEAISILEKVEEATKYKSVNLEAKMIINKNGKELSKMNFIWDYKDKNGEKYQLMRYTYPARLKGTAILMKEKNIWYYNKRTNRTRLLSKSAREESMMGSSFSYDDMQLEYLNDFYAEILEKNAKTYILKLSPKNDEKKYKYIIVEIIRKNYTEKNIKYYDKNNINYKTLETIDIKYIQNKWMPVKMCMKDNINGKETLLEIQEDTIKIGEDIDDMIFSEKNLKR